LSSGSDETRITIDLNYKTSDLTFYYRGVNTSGDNEFIALLLSDSTGDIAPGSSTPPSTLGWSEMSFNNTYTPGTYTFTLSPDSGVDSGSAEIDVLAVVDEQYNYNFDNTTEDDFRLNGPELYPDAESITLPTVTTRRNITDGRFDSLWTNTSNNQSIGISRDASTFQTFNNTSSADYSFNTPTTEITAKFTHSRYGDRLNTTPKKGYLGQDVDLWELFVNPDTPSPDDIGVTNARAIVPPNTCGITGNTVREAGLKSGSTLLTRHELAEFVLEQDQRLASSETNRFKGTE